jgi:UDP-N-acetylglucosamine acyltransferase
MKISPHAAVDPKAEIDADVEIGPFCVIGPDAKIGSGCRLVSSVTLIGHVTIGKDNVFHPQTVIGDAPQDKKYKGSPTRVEIGNGNVFRELVTIHRGSDKGGGVTRVGNNNMLMVNVHLGHDVQLGDNCILANNIMVAGHVVIGNNVNMMGGVGVHQFVSIGDYSFLGGYSRIHLDVPPFVKVDGADQVRGVNSKGLRACGFSDEDIDSLDEACRELFYRKEKPFAAALSSFHTQNGLNPHVKRMVEFLRRRDLGKNGRFLESRRVR